MPRLATSATALLLSCAASAGAQATSAPCTAAPVCVYLNAAQDSGVRGVTFTYPDLGDVIRREQLRFGESAVLPCPFSAAARPVTVQARLNDAACEHEEATIDCLRVFAVANVTSTQGARDLLVVAMTGGSIRQYSWGGTPGLQIANLAAAAVTIGSTCSIEAVTVAPGQRWRVTGAHASMRPAAYVALNASVTGRALLGERECSSPTSTGFLLVLPGASGSATAGQLQPVLCAQASCNRPDPNATGSSTEGGSGGATCDDDDHDHIPVGLAVALSVLGTALVGGIGVYCHVRSRASTVKAPVMDNPLRHYDSSSYAKEDDELRASASSA